MGSFDRLSATLHLDSNISVLPRVSTKRTQALGTMGIHTVRDLLNTFPRRYLDRSALVSIGSMTIGQSCTTVGSVFECKQRRIRRGLTLTEVTIIDGTGTLLVSCFNQPWLANKLTRNAVVSVAGVVEFNYGFLRMTNPVIDVLDSEEDAHGVIIPIHPASGKVSRTTMRTLMHSALELTRGCYDPLPLELRQKYRLCSRYQAYRAIHEPTSSDDIAMARRRLIYEELFMVELNLLQQSHERCLAATCFEHDITAEALSALPELLPFDLTEEQANAVAKILSEMHAPAPMNHLLLGDVGTGKTVVALFALVAAAASGHQAFMMGPTEVLVRQYATSMGTYLDMLNISWGILSGSTPQDARAVLLQRFEQGECSILFGTHALIEPGVCARDASLVVIDEQQRFGVDQRQMLIEKAPGCDVLFLTATPIPRSLALALYGDQTISYIRQRPHAQIKRTTSVCNFSDIGVAYDAVREALEKGQQAYIVCPLIGVSSEELNEYGAGSGAANSTDEYVRQESGADANDGDALTNRHNNTLGTSHKTARQSGQTNTDADKDWDEERITYASIEWGLEQGTLSAPQTAAINHARILQEQVFPQARVGLLHGKLSASEKLQVMDDFKQGLIDILVSTTVVEVGVDVPNATVMIIEDADRFGLAQLHQLRGRVGRGEEAGQVFLISRSKSPDALARLRALETLDDGFALSEFDLKQRCEGDIFGLKQSGKSPLKLVNVVRDAAIVEAAHADAQMFLKTCWEEPDDTTNTNQQLRMLEHERAVQFCSGTAD